MAAITSFLGDPGHLAGLVDLEEPPVEPADAGHAGIVLDVPDLVVAGTVEGPR